MQAVSEAWLQVWGLDWSFPAVFAVFRFTFGRPDGGTFWHLAPAVRKGRFSNVLLFAKGEGVPIRVEVFCMRVQQRSSVLGPPHPSVGPTRHLTHKPL